jgi:glycosidase
VRPAFPPTPTDDDRAGRAIEELHRRLIGVRRRHPWLVDATVSEPDVLTNDLLAFRLTAGDDVLGVVFNVGDAPAQARLPIRAGTVADGDGEVRALEDATLARVAPHAHLLVRPA